MSTFKSAKPVFLGAFVFSAALALSVSDGRLASAGDPTPPASKSDSKAAKEKTAPAGKAAATGKAVPAASSEVTLKGEMICSKCGLHEPGKCQNVLRVKDTAGKETKYYLAKNTVSDDHHDKVCSATAPATVTGKVSDEGGKKVITASAVKFD